MNKTKIYTQKIGKYLRELSVVVVGIAVTFGVSNRITNRNNEKDIELYLNAVKLELQDNLETIKELYYDYYERAHRYEQFLLNSDAQNLHPDTLNSYIYGTHNLNKFIPFFAYKSGAFDMLKFSGMMRLIKDKSKIQNIGDRYSELETLKQFNDFYAQTKTAEMSKFGGITKFKNTKPESLFDFFTCGLSGDMSKVLEYRIKNLEETLSSL